MKFRFAYRNDGSAKITLTDGGKIVKESDAVSYQGIATLEHNGKVYFAVSNYYEGIFQDGVVYLAVEQS